ncbi:MAG: HAMP domain-containing sensor histidine kinase [Erysipelotrichaceae bacterium]
MKKFKSWIEQLSLSQQLFGLILFFVTFFCVFFFVYINGNVNKVIENQMFSTITRVQSTLLESPEIFSSLKPNNYLQIASDPSLKNILIDRSDMSVYMNKDELDKDSRLFRDILFNATRLDEGSKAYKFHYEKTSTYYKITYVNQNLMLVTMMDSGYQEQYKEAITSSVINVTVVVVGLFFIIVMIWMASLIHPLNQIRAFIEKVKDGDDAELKVSRKDEIGEVAEALVNMREELKRQEKTKEEMIHNISHDLKTPIATIKSYGESIKDGIYPYDTLEKSVDVIINNADRLEKKVHSLLYLNRVEYLISQDNEGAITDMRQVIENVVLSIKVIRNDIELKTILDDDIFFDGLEESWRVTVENIMENALRYARTYIKIELHQDELTIVNDGPSMSEERLLALFKPYEKGQGGQFGLGLSIVSKVVKANGYEVAGENTSDGVIFRIWRKPVKEKKEIRKR